MLELVTASPIFGSLRSLRLAHIYPADASESTRAKAVRLLCDALRRPNALARLALDGNRLSDEDALALANSVADQTAIQLDLSANTCGAAGAKKLAEAISIRPGT